MLTIGWLVVGDGHSEISETQVVHYSDFEVYSCVHFSKFEHSQDDAEVSIFKGLRELSVITRGFIINVYIQAN